MGAIREEALSSAEDANRAREVDVPEPPNQTWQQAVLYYPRLLLKYWRQLTGAYGLGFVLMVIAVYGIGQGIGEEVFKLSESFVLHHCAQ